MMDYDYKASMGHSYDDEYEELPSLRREVEQLKNDWELRNEAAIFWRDEAHRIAGEYQKLVERYTKLFEVSRHHASRCCSCCDDAWQILAITGREA